MKYRWDKKYLYWGVTAFCVIATSILFFYVIFYFDDLKRVFQMGIGILKPVIYGLFFGYLLAPGVNRIERYVLNPFLYKKCKITINSKNKKRIRRISILLIFVGLLFVGVGLFVLVIPQLIVSISNLIQFYPYYYENFINSIEEVFVPDFNIGVETATNLELAAKYFENFINNQVLPWIDNIFYSFPAGITGFFGMIKNIFIGAIISVYLLNSKELFIAQFKKTIYAILNVNHANNLINDLRVANQMFSGFICGTLIDSFIIGIICFIGAQLMQLPFGILVSVIIAVTNIIPFFGPYLGAVPSILLIFFVDPVKCIYFIIFIVILQNFDGNILAPKILGNHTGISGFWVVVSVLIGGGVFGIWGLVLAVPVFASLYALTRSSMNRILSGKNMPYDTNKYINLKYVEIEPEEKKDNVT